MSGEEDKKTTKDEGINEVKGEKQLVVKKEEPLPVKEEQLQGPTGPKITEEGATVTVNETKYVFCVNPIREIEKWETIISENKEIYIAPEMAEFIIKNPGLVGSKNAEGFWDLTVKRANLGGYHMSWELREENAWKDLRGKVWLKKRKAPEDQKDEKPNNKQSNTS